jgi:hypothetical protein
VAVVGLDDCVVDAVGFWPGEEKMPEPVGCDVVLEAGGGRVAGRQCPHSSSGVRLFPTGFERVLTAGAVAARKGELCGWRLFAVGLASSFVESPRAGCSHRSSGRPLPVHQAASSPPKDANEATAAVTPIASAAVQDCQASLGNGVSFCR